MKAYVPPVVKTSVGTVYVTCNFLSVIVLSTDSPPGLFVDQPEPLFVIRQFKSSAVNGKSVILS